MRGPAIVCLAVLALGCGRLDFEEISRDADAAPTPDAPLGGALELVFGDDDIVDSSIVESSPERNCGICQHINGGNIEAGLIRVDLTALPSDATVFSATLELFVNTPFTVGGDIDVYAVTEEWTEGDQDADPGVPNWTTRLPGEPWSSDGVGVDSRSAAPFATIVPVSLDEVVPVALPPSLVQAWATTPSENFGFVLKGKNYPGDGGDHPHFFSTEADMTSRRPRFVVRYDRP